MKIKSLLKYIISFTVFAAVAVFFALIANAEAPYTDGQPHRDTDGENIYVDETDCTAFIVNEGVWRQAYYDTSFDFENAALAMRNAMYAHEPSFTAIIGFKKNLMDMELYSADNNFYYFDEILYGKTVNGVKTVPGNLIEAVYRDDGNPYGGDYLRQLTTITRTTYPMELSVSRASTEYCFLKVTYYFTYVTTLEQEQAVSEFVDLWNHYYIQSNNVVQSATTERDKKYYTVKTIYNFITKNIQYDHELYIDVNHTEFPDDSARYKGSHSAYGAIFGNMDGAYEDGFDPSVYEVNKVTQDTQGLYRVRQRDRGRAVCEGYSLLFYYMCKSNGIDCKIVTGDYDREASGKGSDPHAWNMVYLQDSVETAPEWYSVDATFASQRTQKISDYYTVVDYDFFLRGTENASFSPTVHQQAYNDYSNYPLSENDFRFEVGDVYDQNDDNSNYIAIITRRKTNDPEEKYVEDENYVLENYVIIKPDGSCFQISKIEEDENGVEHEYIIPNKGFTYYSTGYYYTCEFIDFAEDIEYTTSGQYLLNAGEYTFELTTVLSNKPYSMHFTIDPLDMSDIEKNYDHQGITVSDSDHSSLVVTENNITLIREFTGTTISFENSNVKIIDSAGAVLNSVNQDYSLLFGIPTTDGFNQMNAHAPGTYCLRILYSGNYTGHIDIVIKIIKGDLSRYVKTVDLHYGNEINVSGRTFKFGNEAANDYVIIKEGVDFTISNVTPYTNVGDEGTFTMTALATSNYLQEGTSVVWNFFVSTPLDLSSAYQNYNFPDQKYTGSAVKPAIPNPTLSGKELTLVEGRDYTATYTNNVNVGTATVTIEFMGNYTGSFTKQFKIVKDGGSSGDSTVPTVGWNVYNGHKVFITKVEYVDGKPQATLLTGWLTENGKKYYFNPKTGYMSTGKTYIGGKYYIFSKSTGELLYGKQSCDGKWYILSKSTGEMLYGKQRCDGKWYILSKSTGEALTGKVRCDGKWYIMMKTTCEMIYGKVRCDGKWYIMSKTTGEMCYGKVSCDGKMYIMSKTTGEMFYGKVTCDGKIYICSKTDGHIFTSMYVTCNNVRYYCDKNGVATKR